eukprot:scaffold132762_cov30-Tisochrysis_lutea.AAC.5
MKPYNILAAHATLHPLLRGVRQKGQLPHTSYGRQGKGRSTPRDSQSDSGARGEPPDGGGGRAGRVGV